MLHHNVCEYGTVHHDVYEAMGGDVSVYACFINRVNILWWYVANARCLQENDEVNSALTCKCEV